MPESPIVILLHGTDEFAIATHIEKLEASLGDPTNADMNISRFDGRLGLDFEALNNAVNAVPFLSPRRLVALVHPSAAFSSPASQKKFLEFLEAIPPTTTLTLVEYEYLKPNHWLMKWFKSAGEKAEIKAYSMPKRWEMSGWIVQETQKQGGKIEPAAAARLAEMVGEDTRIAAQEITKLLTYVNYARPVAEQDVELVSAASALGSIFDMVDALGMGDGKKAQKVSHRLLEDEDPMELWSMVIRQFRLLLQAREMLDEHAGIPEVQKALNLHEFVARKVCNQARRFSMSALESIYHKLLEIDEGAKTSQVTLDLALDTFIVESTRK